MITNNKIHALISLVALTVILAIVIFATRKPERAMDGSQDVSPESTIDMTGWDSAKIDSALNIYINSLHASDSLSTNLDSVLDR